MSNEKTKLLLPSRNSRIFRVDDKLASGVSYRRTSPVPSTSVNVPSQRSERQLRADVMIARSVLPPSLTATTVPVLWGSPTRPTVAKVPVPS